MYPRLHPCMPVSATTMCARRRDWSSQFSSSFLFLFSCMLGHDEFHTTFAGMPKRSRPSIPNRAGTRSSSQCDKEAMHIHCRFSTRWYLPCGSPVCGPFRARPRTDWRSSVPDFAPVRLFRRSCARFCACFIVWHLYFVRAAGPRPCVPFAL
jgi:hypothetical protein